MFTIKRANYGGDPKQRLYMAILHFARVFDMAVFFLSLSYYSSNLYAELLFSDFMKDEGD